MVTGPYDKSMDAIIGENVRNVRNVKGWSQREMARRIDMSFQQIQKYETGYNRLSARRVYELAAIFKVPIEMMFAGLKPTGNQVVVRHNNDSLLLAGQINRIKDDKCREAIISLVRGLAAYEE